jgi:hypothetical protein
MYLHRERTQMRYYHTCENGRLILECGFRDCEDVRIGDRVARGVWLCERPEPVGANECVLEVELPADVVGQFEAATEDFRDGRIFLVPASIANRSAIVNLVS